MQVIIILDLFDECADPAHPTGMNEDAHDSLTHDLSEYGEVVSIDKGGSNG
jgi:hypothetical protein